MDTRWGWLWGLVVLAGCGGNHPVYTIDPNATAAPVASSTPTQPTTPRTPAPPSAPGVAATVEVGATGPGPQRVASDAIEVTGLAFRVANLGPGSVDLLDLTVSARGRLDDAQGLATLRLAEDVDGDGAYDRAVDRVLTSGGFAADDGDATFPVPGVTLAAGETFEGLIAVDFAGDSRAGDDLQLYVAGTPAFTVAAQGGQVAFITSPLAGPVLRVGGWVEPHQALTLPGDGLYPRAVRDGQGNTHVSVYQNNGSSAVFYSLFDGRSYSSPDDVSRAQTAAWNQDLAVDGAGLPHLVWEEWDTTVNDYAVRYTRFDSVNFGWEPSQLVSAGTSMSVVPRVAVSTSGDVHVVWEDHSSSPRILHRVYDGQSWSGIADVSSSTAGNTPRNPAVTALPGGDVLIAWAENGTGQSWVRSRRAQSSGYGPLEIAAFASNGWVERPELTTDGNTAHLVWVEGDEIMHARDAGSGFSLPVNVSRSPNVGSKMPAVAIQGSAVHVFWIESDHSILPLGTARQLAHAESRGGGFGPVELLTRGAGDRSIPTAVGEGDRLRVLWQDWSLGRQRVFETWREPTTLEAPRRVVATGGDPSRTSATQADGGETLVGYALDAGGNPEVFVAAEDHAGLSFGLPENVSRSATPSYRPSLTTARGSVWAAWEEDAAGGFEVRVARRDPSGWSTPAAIHSTTPAYAPALAGGAERLAAVWTEPGPNGDHDLVLREHDGQTWSAPTPLGARSGSSSWNPDVALSPRGALAVAWEEEGTSREVQVAVITSAGAPASIAAVASSARGQFSPQVAWSGDDLHVAWLEDGQVRVASRSAGATSFDPPVDLNLGGAASLDLGVCQGEVLVAWEEWSSSDARVQHAVLTASGWSTPTPLDLSRGPSRRVSVLGTTSGGLRVLWSDGGDLLLRERRTR